MAQCYNQWRATPNWVIQIHWPLRVTGITCGVGVHKLSDSHYVLQYRYSTGMFYVSLQNVLRVYHILYTLHLPSSIWAERNKDLNILRIFCLKKVKIPLIFQKSTFLERLHGTKKIYIRQKIRRIFMSLFLSAHIELGRIAPTICVGINWFFWFYCLMNSFL